MQANEARMVLHWLRVAAVHNYALSMHGHSPLLGSILRPPVMLFQERSMYRSAVMLPRDAGNLSRTNMARKCKESVIHTVYATRLQQRAMA